jgi:hypothetical protein
MKKIDKIHQLRRSDHHTQDHPTILTRNDGTYQEDQEDSRQHQLAPGACDEVW